MRHTGKIFFLFVLVSMVVVSHPKAAALSSNQMEAEMVVNNYFIAMTQGNTSAIKTLLGGDLLKKRKRLLDNPTYPEHLINIYNNARLEITGNMISNDSITINAAITLNSGEKMRRQYLLKRELGRETAGQYLIYSESTPEQMKF